VSEFEKDESAAFNALFMDAAWSLAGAGISRFLI
jgi:hypothetical protein